MILELLEPAAGEILSLEAVQARLGSTDPRLSDLLKESLSVITTCLGYELGRARYRETEFPPGLCALPLSRAPVDQVEVEPDCDFALDREAGLLEKKTAWSRDTVVTYSAGYLLEVSDWSADTYPAGAWARPSKPGVLRFETAGQGASGSVEPVWPTVAGDTVVDGELTWTARRAEELPDIYRALLGRTVKAAFDALDRPEQLIRSDVDGWADTYSRSVLLPLDVKQALERLRGPFI